jgi:hypothetical protein
MTVKLIEQYFCNRCDRQYEKQQRGRVTVTMAIGWFRYVNGSGSKLTTPKGRSWENLDYDLCDICTESFAQWWKAGENSE